MTLSILYVKRAGVRLVLVGIAILCCIWLGSCRKQDNKQSVKIGGHTTILSAPLEVALAKGFYADSGLSASIERVESSKVSMAAMETGDLDVVIGSLSAGSFNMIRKGDLVILADASRVIPSIIIRKDLWQRQITSLGDLKGRAISSPREGSSSYYALSRILRGLGLTIADVNPKYLEETEAVAALEAKQIDAAILNEPYATMAVHKGVGVRYDIGEIRKFFPPNGQQHMVIYTLRKTMLQKPELLHQFLKAYLKGVKVYDMARNGRQPDRSDVVKIIAAYTTIDPQMVEEAVWPYVSPDGKPDESYIKEMHDYFVQNKLVDSPVDLHDVIHTEFLSPAN